MDGIAIYLDEEDRQKGREENEFRSASLKFKILLIQDI